MWAFQSANFSYIGQNYTSYKLIIVLMMNLGHVCASSLGGNWVVFVSTLNYVI